MECHEFDNRLQDWLDGDLDAAEAERLRKHAADCPACGARAEEFRELRRALAKLPAPALSPKHAERMLARVRPRRRTWPIAATAAAAAMAMAALLLPFADWDRAQSGAAKTAPTVEVYLPLHRTRTVRLALSSQRTLENATVVLELPQGIALQNRPDQRVLRWQTDIAAGDNRLSLPLTAYETGVRELVARIEYGDKSQEMRLRLNTRENDETLPARGRLETGPGLHRA